MYFLSPVPTLKKALYLDGVGGMFRALFPSLLLTRLAPNKPYAEPWLLSGPGSLCVGVSVFQDK